MTTPTGIILEDIWETKVVRARDLDPGYYIISARRNNEFCEMLRCKHIMNENTRQCIKCGSTEMEIYNRIRKDDDLTFVDTYKNGEFILRERKVSHGE